MSIFSKDTEDAEGKRFTYDTENKQIRVETVDAYGNPTGTIGEYFYDGDGKRVKKIVYEANGISIKEETIFVYSGGKLIAECSTDLADTPQTKYLTEDHLGTPRIITDGFGQVIVRRDFMPFGEEIYSTIGNRSTQSFKYAGDEDDVRQKFTGYQKDEETQLDFAEARMNETRYAWFTAVDPLLASGKSADPQTFNRYVYVMNSPFAFTDPTGLFFEVSVKI